MKCRACSYPKLNWNSICPKCRFYQHSCLSGKMYNYLKIEGNAAKLYGRILNGSI